MATEKPLSGISVDDTRLASLIVDNAVEYAIFTLDPDGVITSWNKGAEQMLSYPKAEAVGANFAMLFTAPDATAGVPEKEIRKTVTEGRAEDTRWHVRRSGERFWANGVTMAIPGETTLLKIMRDETPAKLAEDQRVLLLNELNHRIKNTLATVQSVAEHTLRSKGVDPGIREDFTRRLMALSEAHNVLVDENWAGADFRAIVERAVSPFQRSDGQTVVIDGPEVRLSPQQAVTLSLALHELATNAVKYGALGVPAGLVSVSWNLSYDSEGRRSLMFLWRESGGPPVRPPVTKGFGSHLLARIFSQAGGAAARIDFNPEGLRCVAEIPLPASTDEGPATEQSGLPAIEI